jgi:hypothetical protein
MFYGNVLIKRGREKMKKFILGILACIAILAAVPAYAAYGDCAFGDCCSGSGSGGSTISGLTTNKLTKATSATDIGNSQVFDNGTNVGVGSNNPVATLDVAGSVRATSFQSSGSTAGVLQLFEASANGSNYINWTLPSSLSANSNYTWPSAVGTAGQVMTASDSAGGINWSSIVQGSGGSVNWASITGDQRTGNWTAISPYINTGAINWQSVYTVNQSVNWGTGFQQADSFNATGTGNTLLNTSSGNVGVGSSNPGAKLDVNGAIRVLGNLAGGTTGNVGIGTFGASAATCDSVCNSTNTRRCFHGMTSGGIPTGCAVSITGTCICLPQS